jgi:O-methyltransferase involved in polyketide biosynthesis
VSPSESISPTAHYTGYVWARHGLSHPELETREGRILFELMRPIIGVSGLFGGASLEAYLLTRHRAIDVLLERAIEHGGISQVIEVACGLSPRGWRFVQRYGDRITYIEADLPDMAARKRAALERMGSLSDRHRVAEVDALRDEGAMSIADAAAGLDRESGLAIVTEGLLGYLPGDAVAGIWRRFERELSGFANGRYISDLHLARVQTTQVRAFRVVLSAFVRGRVHLHIDEPEEAERALQQAGFGRAELHRASVLAPEPRGPGSELAHIIEASTSP